jgi:WD40 repeat protein
MPQVDNSKDTISSSLTIKHAFGSTSSTIDSIQLYPYLVNEKVKHKLVYLSGKNICIQDTQCNSQEFMSGRLKRVKNVIKYIISSNNRFLVACESFRMDKEDIEDKKAVISIYNLITMTRVKTLFHKSDSEFIGCTFCADSKFIAGVTGEPNKEIVIWDWEKEKVIKIIPLESMDVNCIRSPPVPSTMLTISGNGTLKSITLSKDKVVKMDNLLVPSKESATFLNHIWLPFSSVLEHIMVCLTDINDFQTYLSRSRSQSQLQFQSNSQSLSQDSNALQNLGSKRQLVYIFAGNQTDNIVVLEIIQVITVKGNSNQQGFSDSSGPKVENIIATDKGFVLIGNTGFIAIYEHTLEEKDPFTEVRRLCLGDVTLISGVFIREEERMILLTKSNRLIKVTLFAPDQESDSKIKNVQEMKKQTFRRFSMQVTNDDMFSQREQLSSHADDLMFGGNHIMPIRAADSATDRPIVITIGADHTARIWDYENKKCDLVYSFRNDEPVAVAVHPLGFQTLIAFKDFIRLYNILIDELSPLKELQCKRCHDVKYSNSGHLFAAASHVTIFVYDSISFQILTTLNGHIMPIKSLNWVSFYFHYR